MILKSTAGIQRQILRHQRKKSQKTAEKLIFSKRHKLTLFFESVRKTKSKAVNFLREKTDNVLVASERRRAGDPELWLDRRREGQVGFTTTTTTSIMIIIITIIMTLIMIIIARECYSTVLEEYNTDVCACKGELCNSATA